MSCFVSNVVLLPLVLPAFYVFLAACLYRMSVLFVVPSSALPSSFTPLAFLISARLTLIPMDRLALPRNGSMVCCSGRVPGGVEVHVMGQSPFRRAGWPPLAVRASSCLIPSRRPLTNKTVQLPLVSLHPPVSSIALLSGAASWL